MSDSLLPTDQLHRPLRDLRISVTDRCNFRCTFCMPAGHQYDFLPRPEILSFEEISCLARIFARLGVDKIRLTGGEPLLRADIETLVAQLRQIPGVRDLALTTNGYLLERKAAGLVEAGLDRVTVSLHSLDPEIFARVNGLDLPLDRVLAGIEAATAAGLRPVKINAVVLRGVNEHELVDLARFGREAGCTMRFIEYMDVGTVNAWEPDRVVSAREILDRIEAVFPLENVPRERPGDVAHRYRYADGMGEIGVIPSITEPFCGDCSRARLSADGRLYTCLFSQVGHDLKTALRGGAPDDEIAELIASIWRQRADRYSEERAEAMRQGLFAPIEKVEMFRIGG
ncbi:MAG: GTP 3',8-cyclase MoaA [Thermoanaerobaculia bacterium]|nr:GTP 3',8-cyclase MoaA [Thermoanaerobaculia bacterium]